MFKLMQNWKLTRRKAYFDKYSLDQLRLLEEKHRSFNSVQPQEISFLQDRVENYEAEYLNCRTLIVELNTLHPAVANADNSVLEGYLDRWDDKINLLKRILNRLDPQGISDRGIAIIS